MTPDPPLHIGDRFELYPPPGDLQRGLLTLEPALSSLFAQPGIAVTLNGGADAARIAYDAERNVLRGAPLRRLENQLGLLVLECTAADPLRFRLAVEPPPAVQLPARSPASRPPCPPPTASYCRPNGIASPIGATSG